MGLTPSPDSVILDVVSYPGGKSGAGVYQKIINLMPPHPVYIEPFLGGGAIMRMKRPAALNIGIDLDPAVIQTWKNDLVPTRKPAITPGPSPVLAISAAIAESGERCRSSKAAMTDPIAQTGDTRSRFLQADGIAFLRSYPFTGAELVYCDPPYLMSTRSGKRLYRCEMTTLQHRRLLRVVRELPCRVMISGYWSKMYAEALPGWNSIHFQAMTRGGRPATEWLWFNFEPPVALHDYRYLGQTFRERERIARQKRRWLARLRKMPTLQRQALLSAIAALDVPGDEVLPVRLKADR